MAAFEGPFLIALAGLPASGKTTFASLLSSKLSPHCSSFVMIVSTDDVRAQFPILKEKFLPESEGIIRRLTAHHVEAALREGLGVICDDLNYYRSMRHEWHSLSMRLQVPYFLIHIDTSEQTCLEWNKKRGRPVPDEVITKVNARFDPFHLTPWDHPLLVVASPEGIAEKGDSTVQEILSGLESYTPPPVLEEKAAEPTRAEVLENLSRDVVGNLYGKGLKAKNPKSLASFRKSLVREALEKSLDDEKALALFKESLSCFVKEELNQKE